MTLAPTLDLVMRDRGWEVVVRHRRCGHGGGPTRGSAPTGLPALAQRQRPQPRCPGCPSAANAPAPAANASNAGDGPARRPHDQPVTRSATPLIPDQSVLVTEDRRKPGLRNFLGLLGRPVLLSLQPIIAAVFHPVTGIPHHHRLGADGFPRAVLPHNPAGAFLHHQDPGSGRLAPQDPVLRARDALAGPVLLDREPLHGLSQPARRTIVVSAH